MATAWLDDAQNELNQDSCVLGHIVLNVKFANEKNKFEFIACFRTTGSLGILTQQSLTHTPTFKILFSLQLDTLSKNESLKV